MLMPQAGIKISLLQKLQKAALKMSLLGQVEIVGNHHVSPVTENIDHPLETGIVGAVAFKEPWRCHSPKEFPVALPLNIGNNVMH
jgi:hypothetical protein